MGICMTQPIPEDLVLLRNGIDYVESIDINTVMDEESPHSVRMHALEVMRHALGDLTGYARKDNQFLNPRIVVDKVLYFAHAYKYFMDNISFPIKTFFQPMKDATIQTLQTIDNVYDLRGRQKLIMIEDAVSHISDSYRNGMNSYYDLQEELRQMN